ncbi:MAG: L-methionine (R)-S-oxide reductase, partial [Flavobacteriales bacterium]
MAEIEFSKESLSKSEKYQELITQVPALLDPSVDWVANSANLSAALKEVFGWLWVGFYRKVS